ncbi:fimbrial biogenesis chaperone [Novosphingobium album (ex Liu et al. 2023)]|uniref:fimbrial biogenesis chaperone n=1 Tax=Novosphingobium album (ex Liu et al. 2023) TaxID=3031130 RepID=UPI0023B04173|nr:molecular chaperone [Novosphingobium album (ex Liu et al. 2023)]
MTAIAATAMAAATPAPAVRAATPLLIWPIDPVITADRGGAMLWLENRGKTPAMLQIRVYRWTQADGQDQYEEQREVSASPPVVEIPGGQRQVIRLSRQGDQRAPGESAYRIIIDEVPTRATPANPSPEGTAAGAVAVQFQMRYSLPLFTYGAGTDPASVAAASPRAAALLRCELADGPQGKALRLRNIGPVHARVVDLSLTTPAGAASLGAGLVGYVLPGAALTRPLPKGATGREPLSMAGRQGERITIAGCAPE